MRVPAINKAKALPVLGSFTAIIAAMFVGLAVDVLREIAAVAIIKYGHDFVDAATKYYKARQEEIAAAKVAPVIEKAE